MVVYRTDIINNMEQIFQTCLNEEKRLLDNRFAQNDIRVTFFKHMNNTLDASIHFMMLLDSHFRDPEDMQPMKSKYKKYGISQRKWFNTYYENYKKDLYYTDEYLLNSYFIFVFHTFEYSLRTIFKECFPADYYVVFKKKKKAKNFSNLWDEFVTKTGLNNDNARQNFRSIVFNFRNSIHNNGVFLSPSGNSPVITWKGSPYSFVQGKQIQKSDLWNDYILFTREFMSIFTEIMKLKEVKSLNYIEDITEQII